MTSQNRAVDARDSGHFDKEIVPVTTPDGTEVTQDDGPRPGTTMEKLAALQPVFKPRAARSRPATPARSTTAPPRCSS